LEAAQVLRDQQRELEQLELASTEQELELSEQRNRQTILFAGLLVLFVTASGLLALAWWRTRALSSIRASHEELRVSTERLTESELRYRSVFEDALVPKLLVDLTGRTILDANGPAAALCGRAARELAGRRVDDVDPAWLGAHLPAVTEELPGEACGLEVWRDAEGERHTELLVTPLQLSGRPCAVVTVRDVTERHKLEEERIRVDKLESLGVLAGGIAHDFNNALARARDTCPSTPARARGDADVARPLEAAEAAVQRAAHLTGQLLAFARGGEPRRALCDVAQLTWDSVNFALSGSQVGVEFDITPDLWAAEVDTAQFGQVVSNLVLNAVQAMDGVAEARLVVVARNLPEGAAGGHGASGPSVLIQLRDVGHGIPDEIRDKLCDPYFSTRAGGTGLGLATVFAVVSRHGGWLDIESRPGAGTTVSVAFPASPTRRPEGSSETADVLGGSGRVLVMDDDPLVQDVFAAALPELGFEVEVVAEGAQAVARHAAALDAGQPFDLVIMDLTVPGGMGGREAMAAIRAREPDALGIAASGYSKDPVMSNFRAAGFAGALPKPFTISGLGRLTRKVLEGRASRASAGDESRESAPVDPPRASR
jgi:PAS domain S-box-containing protein